MKMLKYMGALAAIVVCAYTLHAMNPTVSKRLMREANNPSTSQNRLNEIKGEFERAGKRMAGTSYANQVAEVQGIIDERAGTGSKGKKSSDNASDVSDTSSQSSQLTSSSQGTESSQGSGTTQSTQLSGGSSQQSGGAGSGNGSGSGSGAGAGAKGSALVPSTLRPLMFGVASDKNAYDARIAEITDPVDQACDGQTPDTMLGLMNPILGKLQAARDLLDGQNGTDDQATAIKATKEVSQYTIELFEYAFNILDNNAPGNVSSAVLAMLQVAFPGKTVQATVNPQTGRETIKIDNNFDAMRALFFATQEPVYPK